MTEWLDAGPRASRRRRWPVVALAALLALLVGVVLLPRAFPREVVDPLPDEASSDPWPAGTWQRTHRVDLPDGWQVREERIEAYRSTTLLLGPAGTPTNGGQTRVSATGCTVVVGRADAVPVPLTEGEPVRVHGAEAVFVPVDGNRPGLPFGVFWAGPDGARASVACSLDEPRTLALAARVVFARSPVRVPVRLTALPSGYHPDTVRLRGGSDLALTVQPDPPQPGSPAGPGVPLRAWSQPGPLRMAEPHEWVAVAGRPAWMRAEDRQLCLTRTPVACVAVDRVDTSGGAWPEGVRDLLLAASDGLVPAPDPGEPGTWFDATSAFPSR